ncbi:NUDIX domain-containing protein [Ferrimonas balearica]|uniref:NUDIX domain-containing protein n=1 Tax=Ferrimonas balearica TaxID=44012 RepID=UPI001C99A05F|nr:NUDIX domain-containing protein [Ferrimonas balearica]MBY5923423.1 NUDIX domain-containing protein [Ferrimonas balearica]MBY5995173.1 NUDIX domain-containing protein [Ferrimonas balearica]
MSKNRVQKYGKAELTILDREYLFRGFFNMEAVTFRHQRFDGHWSEPVRREVFERGDAAVVLPYDPVSDKVILVEQLRVPAARTSQTPWLLELPAGIIEADEAPESVARRELEEETGLTAHSLTFLYSYLPSPGACSERLYLYLAEVQAPESGEALFGLDDEHEDILRHVVSREQAMAWVEDGTIDNASTILGLQWLALKREALFGPQTG